jgi:protein-tyrosine phosphatase
VRQIAGRRLWLGHAGDLRDAGAVAAGFGAVVELADSEPFAVLPRELVRCRYPLSDGGDNPTWLLRLAAESVATMLRAEVPVLVCCSAGMSRSICVSAAGLALAEGRPFREALSLVVETGPVDVSPRLLLQFQQALSQPAAPA